MLCRMLHLAGESIKQLGHQAIRILPKGVNLLANGKGRKKKEKGPGDKLPDRILTDVFSGSRKYAA